VLELIDQRKLWGHDLGWIDAHLLASALLSNCRFWTLDEDLHGAATDLGLI
jgi:predicted nucleic acid-binding protein